MLLRGAERMARLVTLIARVLLAAGGLVAGSCGLVALCISFAPATGQGEQVVAAGVGIIHLALGGVALFAAVWWSGWNE
jgi:hypothetical protein